MASNRNGDSRFGEDRFLRFDPRFAGSTRARDRMPDAALVLNDGESTTLFQHVCNPDGHSWGWRLLPLDGAGRANHSPLASAARDLNQVMHRALGLSDTPAILPVRPDGHLAFRGNADAMSALVEHVATFAVPAAR